MTEFERTTTEALGHITAQLDVLHNGQQSLFRSIEGNGQPGLKDRLMKIETQHGQMHPQDCPTISVVAEKVDHIERAMRPLTDALARTRGGWLALSTAVGVAAGIIAIVLAVWALVKK